jgi:hypothetical protein
MGRLMGDDQPDSAAPEPDRDMNGRRRSPEVAWLTSPLAVAERCGNIFEAGRAGDLEHFRVIEDRLGEAARYVAAVIEERHPNLAVPPHSRWRHFRLAARDLWHELAATSMRTPTGSPASASTLRSPACCSMPGRARLALSPCPTGTVLSRSEGLAIASFEAFRTGVFSSDPRRPLMADADGLLSLSEDRLAGAFQVSPANPLPGLANRVALLRKLGQSLGEQRTAGAPAPGGAVRPAGGDERRRRASVLDLFGELQRLIGPIWPGRLELDGVNLGDTWPHPKPAARGRRRPRAVPQARPVDVLFAARTGRGCRVAASPTPPC